jgi:hypothetical protein
MRTHQAPRTRRHRLLRWRPRRRVSPRPRQACHRRAPPSEEPSIPTRAATCAAPLSSYTLDFRFPVDYPDQQALTDTLTQERDQFVGWVAQAVPRPFTYELDVVGKPPRVP